VGCAHLEQLRRVREHASEDPRVAAKHAQPRLVDQPGGREPGGAHVARENHHEQVSVVEHGVDCGPAGATHEADPRCAEARCGGDECAAERAEGECAIRWAGVGSVDAWVEQARRH